MRNNKSCSWAVFRWGPSNAGTLKVAFYSGNLLEGLHGVVRNDTGSTCPRGTQGRGPPVPTVGFSIRGLWGLGECINEGVPGTTLTWLVLFIKPVEIDLAHRLQSKSEGRRINSPYENLKPSRETAQYKKPQPDSPQTLNPKTLKVLKTEATNLYKALP